MNATQIQALPIEDRKQIIKHFVSENIEEARSRALARSTWIRKNRVEAATTRPRIFMFWAQGFPLAPPVVQACHKAALRHNHDNMAFLDRSSAPYYVDIDDHIIAQIGENHVAYSDMLRVELVSKFGGVWADATCFFTEPLMEHYTHMLGRSGLFLFKKFKSKDIASNWFMASEAGNYLMCLQREILLKYWTSFNFVIHYFFYHQILKELCDLDAQANQIYEGIVENGWQPRSINRKLKKNFDQNIISDMLSKSPVHKLSYKAQREKNLSKTTLAAIVRGEVS